MFNVHVVLFVASMFILNTLMYNSYFEERTNLGGRAKKLIEIAEKLSIQLE